MIIVYTLHYPWTVNPYMFVSAVYFHVSFSHYTHILPHHIYPHMPLSPLDMLALHITSLSIFPRTIDEQPLTVSSIPTYSVALYL